MSGEKPRSQCCWCYPRNGIALRSLASVFPHGADCRRVGPPWTNQLTKSQKAEFELTRMIQPGGGAHKPVTLVFSGGGARGLSHAGVLRALVAGGYVPNAVVGVSMGAVVGATYALNDDWYDALVGMDTRAGFRKHRTFTCRGWQQGSGDCRLL